jgi:SAM-dependent methyltransferase
VGLSLSYVRRAVCGGREMKQGVVQLDLPSEGVIRFPMEELWGWIEMVRSPNDKIEFVGNRNSLRVSEIVRPGLDPRVHFGFLVYIDLVELYPAESDIPMIFDIPKTLPISVFNNGDPVCQFHLTISLDPASFGVPSQALRDCRKSKESRSKFIRESCRRFSSIPGCSAPSSLPEGWNIDPDITKKKDLSGSHFYDSFIQTFITQLGSEAMILDDGAGFRKIPYPNVVNLEIYDYPSTDIIAGGEELPFVDDVFDGVLSLSVLDHVRDPFKCAREIRRVLKPGGRVMALVPFLTSDHGYPSHYFNATRFGVQVLFDGMHMEEQFIHPWNQPIFTLHDHLRLYAAGLPVDVQERFLSMKVSELVNVAPQDWMTDPISTRLSPETAWLIAWGTTSMFVK